MLTVNGVSIPEKKHKVREITLPSGAVAIVRLGYGRDLIKVQKEIGKETDLLPFALIATLTQINGQQLQTDLMMDMELPDVFALQAEVMPNFLPPAK
jgi:hypothetical protein